MINSPSVSLTPLTSSATLTVNNSTPGLLIVSVFGTNPLVGSGSLVDITFNAVGPIGSSSGVNFTSFIFNEGTSCLSTSNGSVNIISGSVSGLVTYANSVSPPPVVRTVLSGTGSVNVSTQTDLTGAYTLNGFGSGAYTVTPSKTDDVNGITSFDSARIAQHVVNLISLNSTQLLAADVSANNAVTSFDAALIAQYIVLIPNPGITGTWKFIPVSRSYPNVETSISGQDYSAILMGEVSGNWTPPSSFAPLAQVRKRSDKEQLAGNVAVTVPTTPTSPTSNFTIPLNVGDTTGKGIISYQFDFLYNPAIIAPQALPCDVVGTLNSNLLATCNVPSAGLLKVSVFGTIPTVGAGVLIKLKFNAIGTNGQSSPATLQNFLFNEGDPTNTVTNGVVNIISVPTAANVEVGGMLMTAGGRAVSNGIVTLTDSTGGERTVRSNSFGYFRFTDVPSGANYVIGARVKGLTFNPQTLVVNDDISSFTLIAEP